jgi:hypothetical protein
MTAVGTLVFAAADFGLSKAFGSNLSGLDIICEPDVETLDLLGVRSGSEGVLVLVVLDADSDPSMPLTIAGLRICCGPAQVSNV